MNTNRGVGSRRLGVDYFQSNLTGQAFAHQRRKSTIVPDMFLMKSIKTMIRNMRKRKKSADVEVPVVKNPYLEKIRCQSVGHPLDTIPEFCRLDMVTKKGKSFLPDIKIKGKNELLNERVMKEFFEKVFHNDSVNFLHNQIKDLNKKKDEKLQNVEMAMTLKPDMNKSDLMRANSIRKYKKEIKRLSKIVEELEGKNPFKDGEFANLISSIHHQEFFKTDFKLGSIDSELENLTNKQKIHLLDRVIERFDEVDLEKQKQFICDNRTINKVYISKDSLNQKPVKERISPNKHFFMKRRQRLTNIKIEQLDDVSESEDIESKEFDFSPAASIMSTQFKNSKVQISKRMKSKAIYIKKTVIQKEKERFKPYEVNKLNSKIKDIVFKH
ncbi:unnamed protein product [Moneuplotes crassus]|uniref:Uncharacterized protein n=1 Tax=Euplotes crassus TaxID=5936 RepID=A0AAD1UEX7_EUPCR|nr:unnamed protein product [Moneuplotes crassus]